MQIQDCEKMDQSLCLMARDILKKLHEQNRTTAFASLMEGIHSFWLSFRIIPLRKRFCEIWILCQSV